MRSSIAALWIGCFSLVAGATGCRIEVHTQTQFEASPPTTKSALKEWGGEPIKIVSDGINPLVGTGGIEVKVDANATKISLEAVVAAHADDDKKADADLSIADAIKTIEIVEGSTIEVRCGHGGAHGTSSVAGSGCKMLRVVVPAGTATKPLDLEVGAGNGDIRVGWPDGSSAPPNVKRLRVESRGIGDIRVRATPIASADVAGPAIQIKGDDAIEVALPQNFEAKQVVLDIARESTAEKRKARINTSDFPGMETGKPFPVTGTLGAGAINELNIKNDGLLSDDTITVKKF